MTLIVGGSLYHLYVALILIELGYINGRYNIIFNVTRNEYILWKNCLNYELLRTKYNFIMRLQSHIIQVLGLNILKDKFFYSRFNCDKLIAFLWRSDRISSRIRIPYDLADEVVLIEDGAMLWHASCDVGIRRLLKTVIGFRYDFINDEKVKSVYVTSKYKYPTSFINKIKDWEIGKLEASLSPESVKAILSVFGEASDILQYKDKKLCFLFTQPLFVDKHITEITQYEYYRQMCLILSKGFRIIIKPHPRDTMDYSDVPNTIIFPSKYPSELMNIMKLDIHLAVGICTSAVETINAEHKININRDFLKDKKLSLKKLEAIVKECML